MNASSAPQPRLSPSSLAERYRAVRAATDALAAPLTPEDCALQSMASASPVKWHLAHTSWFFETFLLGEFVSRYAPLKAEYRTLFNSYYVQVGERWPRPERGLLSRPSLDEVREYRRHVDRAMEELLASPPAGEARVVERVELGLQHEQQHQELLLTDVKHLFSLNPLRPAYREPAESSAARVDGGAHLAARGDGGAPWGERAAALRPRWHRYEEGVREIGHRGTGFAFDNETPRHAVHVAAFELASRLVTNRDFLAFLEDGGYRRPELWLSEGFDAVRENGWSAPLYWEQRDGRWRRFTLAGLRRLDLDEPLCHVSYFEADAFARWSGCRLPTEAEWEVAAAPLPVAGNFVESGALDPVPLARDEGRGSKHVQDDGRAPKDAHEDGRTPKRAHDDGCAPQQMFGDVWEWTRSAYAPYPGFRAAEGALGEYNGKFMVNQIVLRGGSCVSPRDHLRASYRNFFHPHERWQFMGLRLARDVS